jgi:hypothetical protein
MCQLLRFVLKKGNTALTVAGKCKMARELFITLETTSHVTAPASIGSLAQFLFVDAFFTA